MSPDVSPPDPQAIVCPSCGASFSGATLGKRKKVQCPKCREVVVLEAKSSAATLDALKAEMQGLRAELERLSGLEARLVALEQMLGVHLYPPPAEEPAPTGHAVHLKWLPRPNGGDLPAASVLDARREEILEHNLQQSPGHVIAIRSAVGDPQARQLAERFKAVFERSHWRVLGVEEGETPMTEPGIALAAGSLPAPPDLATAYIAFTAAGFELVSRLDPSLEPSEAVLFVA